MKKLSRPSLLFMMLLIGIVGCKKTEKEDDPETTEAGATLMSAKIDGKSFTTKEDDVYTLLTLIEKDSSFFLTFANGSLVSMDPIEISVDIRGENFYELKKGMVFDTQKSGNEEPDNINALYTANSVSTPVNSTNEGTRPSKVTITKLDTKKQLISVSFEFEAIDFQTEKVHKITEGKFENMYYGED